MNAVILAPKQYCSFSHWAISGYCTTEMHTK